MTTARIGPTFAIEIAAADLLGRCSWFDDGRIIYEPDITPDEVAKIQRVFAAHDPGRLPDDGVPDGPTLSDWRVALTLWGRMDDVTTKVASLVSSADPSTVMLGKIAKERLEYANNVQRSQLLQLRGALGFTVADVDESLRRAHQVSVGDLSGKWPLV